MRDTVRIPLPAEASMKPLLPIIAIVLPVGLAAVTVPHTFSNGAVADADQMNANFGALANAINAGAETLVPLTDAASIAVNGALGNVFEVTLGGNRTLANPTNVAQGRRYRFIIRQDATGGRTLAFGTAYRFSSATPPNLSTAASTISVLEFVAVDGNLHALGTHIGPCASGSAVFRGTGADQNFTVPGGCTSITVKLWGAGGGGGGGPSSSTTATGGGGGYSRATLAVTPGETLTIIVGIGGHGSSVAPVPVYGGGGRGCGTNCASYGGGGGGRSAIRRSATELVTAGAGGGGQWNDAGGAGGGENGVNGSTPNLYQGESTKGIGGTQLAGGAGGCGTAGCSTAGSQYQGGTYSSGTYTSGGGGGYFGGGGGGTDNASSHDGGGGGSGFVPAGGVTTAGSGQTAGNISDSDWETGAGRGGDKQSTGGNGLVVVRWGP